MLSMSPAAQFRSIHDGHQIQPGFFIGILLTCVTITTSLVLNSWNDIIHNKMTGYRSYWTDKWTETNSFPVSFRPQLPVYLYVELKETTCIRELVLDDTQDTLTNVKAALTFRYPNTSLPFDHPRASDYTSFNSWESSTKVECIHLQPQNSHVSVSILPNVWAH